MGNFTSKQWIGMILLAMAVVLPYSLVWVVLGITPVGIIIGIINVLVVLVGATLMTDNKTK